MAGAMGGSARASPQPWWEGILCPTGRAAPSRIQPQLGPSNGSAGTYRRTPLAPTPTLIPCPTSAHPRGPAGAHRQPNAPLTGSHRGSPHSAALTRGLPAASSECLCTTSCPAAGGTEGPQSPNEPQRAGAAPARAPLCTGAPGARHVPAPPEHRNHSPSLAPTALTGGHARLCPMHGCGAPAPRRLRGGRFAGSVLQEGEESSYFLPTCQLPAQDSQPRAAGSFLHRRCERCPPSSRAGPGPCSSLEPGTATAGGMGPQGPRQEPSTGGNGMDPVAPHGTRSTGAGEQPQAPPRAALVKGLQCWERGSSPSLCLPAVSSLGMGGSSAGGELLLPAPCFDGFCVASAPEQQLLPREEATNSPRPPLETTTTAARGPWKRHGWF